VIFHLINTALASSDIKLIEQALWVVYHAVYDRKKTANLFSEQSALLPTIFRLVENDKAFHTL
jgi:hypothetical protein